MLFYPVEKPLFTFVDLFAGIGGFRLALQKVGGRCVFSSEIDRDAQKTYYYNFGDIPHGDITRKEVKDAIPQDFDILCGGFPCQAFSIAGYRKGFEDTRGTLFFDVAEIVSMHRPKVVFLENVKNLYTHDEGRTFRVIKQTIENLDYTVFHKVMNAMEYADIPQNRERIFIVAFDNRRYSGVKFHFPGKQKLTRSIHDFIDEEMDIPRFFYGPHNMKYFSTLEREITSPDTVYQWRRQYVRENKNQVCPTLTANMGTGGHNVPIILTPKGIRKLSPRECLNFQGFYQEYDFPEEVSYSSRYKQAGNSVVVPLIEKICKNILPLIL